MIEVLFGESEAASMKTAKSRVIYMTSDGPTAVWMAGKKKPSERTHTGWIEGTSEEVICLGFLLDIGDIRKAADSDYRKNLIYSLYAREAWGKNEDTDRELRQLCDIYCEELRRLKEYLSAGEEIRVWYSNSPYSLCGFYHLCDILSNYKKKVHVVKLPEYRKNKNVIISYQNWGEVAAEEFAGFLSEEKILSVDEIRMYAAKWNELKEDKSLLRASVNGEVVGVPEEFYDFLIYKRISETPVKQARLIGDILGYYRMGISDLWYAKRIDVLIRQGKIEIVEDSVNKYARLIRKRREEWRR